jgi:formylglycine-generating enzyme required for sulfatase activity
MNKLFYTFTGLLIIVLTRCNSSLPTETPHTDISPILSTPTTASTATISSSPSLGTSMVSSIDGMNMVFVPKGEFKMGSEHGLIDEQPLHTVMLDSYWLDKTEVTNAMYGLCVEAGQCNRPNLLASYEDQNTPLDYFDDTEMKDHPVAFVSWNDAKNYCSWADRRLPTEAEWEKAAIWDPVTNEQRVFPWGNEYDCKMGNFDDETILDASIMPSTSQNCDGFPRSAPVGSFPQGASPYGALDMGGNVWEWVNDAFIETDPFTNTVNYYAVSPTYNPPGVDPTITEYRVIRGGSWNFTFGFGRSSYRLWYGKDDTYDGVGFRCASSE